MMKETEVKKIVREGYARIAKKSSCCAPKATCCGSALSARDISISKSIGYTEEDISSVPEGANLGLGCGNPIALASLKKGETVLDLGSGAGFDCFLAANRIGEKGQVIGVDMTPEMIDKARENARKGAYKNVEFRLGEIENLPAADSSVDAIISNCVINLAPDKKRVFQEAFRVLRPGGRLMVSDMVLLKALPEAIADSVAAYVGCIGGAVMKDDYLSAVREAGFLKVKIIDETRLPLDCVFSDPTAQALIGQMRLTKEDIKEIGNSMVSVKVQGTKPKQVLKRH